MCTLYTIFVKPSENRDRRNIWQATKHPPCKALFVPYQNSFLQEETKKLKSKLVTLISNISISEKKVHTDFVLLSFQPIFLYSNPVWKRINVGSAQTSKMTFNSRHLLNVYLEDSMRLCMQGKHE